MRLLSAQRMVQRLIARRQPQDPRPGGARAMQGKNGCASEQASQLCQPGGGTMTESRAAPMMQFESSLALTLQLDCLKLRISS